MVTAANLGEYEVTPRLREAARRWSPNSEVLAVAPMHGASSLTFRAELELGPDQKRIVIVKVAPPGMEPVRNRDVLRQAAVLRELDGHHGVPTPRVLFEMPGQSLDEPPFFAMDFLAGECVEPVLDEPLLTMPEPHVLRERAMNAVRVLAALHRVDTGAGVFSAERPVSLDDEIDRWERAFATVPDRLRPDAEVVAQRLRSNVPDPCPPALLHGDFRLGNLICRGPAVVGVVDWEIWSLGDPRIDLLWFLLFTDPARLPVAIRRAPGMPSVAELVQAYAEETGRDTILADLQWFDALIQFKQAAVTALIVKHNRRRRTPDPILEQSARQIRPLMERAQSLLG